MMRLASLRLLSAGSFAFLAFATPANAVKILLSNDDGYNAPGIVALYDALVAAGHTVTIVAPDGNRSGSSTALTFGPFQVLQISSNVYSVGGTPANTVKFGAWLLTGPNAPELVVSGINSGSNIGPSTVISGTVGNAIAAIEEVDNPIPAIAFSTDLIESGPADSPNNVKHFRDVAKFAAKLVHRFTWSGRVRGLEPGLALNVNYPGLAPSGVKGVRIANQGLTPNFTNVYNQIDATHYSLASTRVQVTRDVRDADTILFQNGYITIVPIDGDYTASIRDKAHILPYLLSLKP